MQPQIQQSKTLKRLCKGSDWFGYDELTLFFLAFSWTVGMKNTLNLNFEKLENLTEQPGNLIPLDRGKGVPSFDKMMDIALVEVDFHDPTTNVRGRRALAIAKPTPRGY